MPTALSYLHLPMSSAVSAGCLEFVPSGPAATVLVGFVVLQLFGMFGHQNYRPRYIVVSPQWKSPRRADDMHYALKNNRGRVGCDQSSLKSPSELSTPPTSKFQRFPGEEFR